MAETLRPSRPTMLVIGDAVAETGFARVLRAILEPMATRYDIHQLAISYFGDPHEWPWKLYPAARHGDAFGANRLANLFDTIKPDLVFMVSNLPRVRSYMGALGERAKTVPIVVYTAVEAGPISTDFVPPLRDVNCTVFYTDYSKGEFDKAVRRQEDEALRSAIGEVRAIPHGVDASMFFPLDPDEPNRVQAKRRAKEKLFQGREEHVNSFVVLNANRNQPRKRIDLTVRGFAEFAKDKDEFVKLHLHMGSPDVGWDVSDLCRRFGVYDRLIVTNLSRVLPGVPSEEMNLIYNAADVGVSTASSEGWGLVSFEHAATNTAQIVPKHTSLEELWTGRAEMLDPVFTLNDPEMRADQFLVSPEGVAAALERLYVDEAYRNRVANLCYEHATRPCYDWNRISEQWDTLFEQFLERK